MKKHILTLLAIFFLTGMALKAQTFKATYEYDANGNRKSAKVIYLSQSPSGVSPKAEDELIIDQKKNLTITLFPNPTQGELRVELAGATSEQFDNPNNAIRMWDTQGKLLFTVKSISTSNRIDLSQYGNGVYIMQLFFNGKVKDFRIVKN